jgi:methylenetetrahydrofolate dehydrogenase (NADP+)/methenyltetrahydrofolate cyclohydrolase
MMPEHTLLTKENGQQSGAKVLDGAVVAEAIKREAAEEVARLREEHAVRPGLAVVRVGDDPASAVYVRNKVRTSEALGIYSEHHALDEATSTSQLLELIATLNRRDDIDGILVQLPLPREVDEAQVLESVSAKKDVDGFHPLNVGKLALGQFALAPCTPAGIIELLKRSGIEMCGANACIVGRNIVGRPLAQLLLQQDATITICHSRTRDFRSRARRIFSSPPSGARALSEESTSSRGDCRGCRNEQSYKRRNGARVFGSDELDNRLRKIRERGYTLVGDVHPAEADAVAGWRTPVRRRAFDRRNADAQYD